MSNEPPNVYELVSRLTEAHRALSEDVRAFIARADERCKGHDQRTGNVEHTIYGNGSPGLKTRMDQMETKMYMGGAILGVIMPVVYLFIEKYIGV